MINIKTNLYTIKLLGRYIGNLNYVRIVFFQYILIGLMSHELKVGEE